MPESETLCHDCFRYHEPPTCGHDPGKPCQRCKTPRGYPSHTQAHTEYCWRCEEALYGQSARAQAAIERCPA